MSSQLTPLAHVVTTDLAAITRGRPVTEERLGKATKGGFGWVPANLCLTPFNSIGENPWGSSGDLRLMPDLAARHTTGSTGASTPFDMVMADIVELDGSPWEGCPRTQLKAAIAALKAATGLSVIAAFEQEFLLLPATDDPSRIADHAFSMAAFRAAGDFGPMLATCLAEAGVEPEMILPEYGKDQFEITHAPAPALVAADRAIVIREVTREVARGLGRRAGFAPKPQLDAVGNGVHIHFSFVDAAGRPATYAADGPGKLSPAAASFCAGVLRHLPALVALTASSPPSYYRLAPHNWSSSYTWLGDRDREATLRICPVVTMGGSDPARQFNIEYRAADATANPYLALAGIIRAGLAGIEAALPVPPIVSGDPTLMTQAELDERGLVRLPETLEAALEALAADTTARRWFPEKLIESFFAVKRTELAAMAGKDRAEICAIYGERY
jgi:glutamine synthetase